MGRKNEPRSILGNKNPALSAGDASIPEEEPQSQVWGWKFYLFAAIIGHMQKVTKAVIPAAGFGTRFLPQTKAMPKEMLPLVDKPIIQVVVEELVEAGIKDIILVTGSHKRAIEDHFDKNPELEAILRSSKKLEEISLIKKIISLANFIYVRQKGPVGNATPISNCLSLVRNETFLVFWGDDFVQATPSRAKQLIEVYQKYGAPVLGAIRTNKKEDTKKYGFAKGKKLPDHVVEVEEIVEKPGIGKAPSNLATVSGFLLTPEVAPYIQKVVKGANKKEPNYIDALSLYIKAGGKVYAKELQNARYFDTGSKQGYLEAVVEYGLKNPETKASFRRYLKQLNF